MFAHIVTRLCQKLSCRHSPRRHRRDVFAALESLESRNLLTGTNLMDFLPAGYQYGPNSSSDPVFQQGYVQWMAATSQQPPATGGGGSFLDNYANFFNNTFGSGLSNTVGGAIYTVLPVSDATLANTSDAALVTGTTLVSIPLAVGILAGGEVILGVGTFGGGTATATAGTLTTVSTGAGTVHVSTAGTVATVEVGFIETITPNLVHTVTQAAISQGATSAVVNTGPVVATDLAISLGLAAQNGTTVLGGTVTLVEGGAYPIFEILIPLL